MQSVGESHRLIPHASYILPLRWTSNAGLVELTGYLNRLTEWIEVIVVDGSPERLFTEHAKSFPNAVRHVRPLPLGLNGKAAGVMTGIGLSAAPILVLADDDIRYDAETLQRAVVFLGEADIVRPQNYFLCLPWHAHWDTARTLINRAFGSDYPGTLILRRQSIIRTGGYDGNVLFENLELLRTIRAAGGQEVQAKALYIGRLPPSVRQFIRQRVRQAYDDFTQPGRLGMELSLLPMLLIVGRLVRRRVLFYAGVSAAACLLAEIGRRRHGGQQVFRRYAALWSPLWVLERSVCVWVALAFRLTGGMPYAGSRLRRAGNLPAALRRKHHGKLQTTTERDHYA